MSITRYKEPDFEAILQDHYRWLLNEIGYFEPFAGAGKWNLHSDQANRIIPALRLRAENTKAKLEIDATISMSPDCKKPKSRRRP